MKRKGFTLIELLAVIIILGILLLIAIPGVTGYINNSRKNIYVDTAKELIKGTSKLLNIGDFDALDSDVTYYMDSRCIANESGKEAQSPFGKFDPAYVIIVSEDDEFNYYFQSRDETEVGVKDITKMDNLQISKIVSNVKEEDIDTTVAIGETSKTAIIDQNCNVGTPTEASRRVSKDGESTITLTYDMDECSPTERYYHEEWGKLCRPKRAGYKLKGWYTKKNGEGVKIKKNDLALESLNVYAYWVEQEEATFDIGKNVNIKIKRLAGETSQYLYENYENYNITSIKYSEDEPGIENQQPINLVSSSNSAAPIYMWYDNGILWWWSDDDTPRLNEKSSNLFRALTKLESIDELDYFDTSLVKEMASMFYKCSSITELDLSEFDTRNVYDMSNAFYYCNSIINLDLSSFDTPNLKNMLSMFKDCKMLEVLDISNMNTSKVVNMEELFYECNSLKELDLSNFNTSLITSFASMFYECSSLENLDLSSFNTSNVKYMGGMFRCCKKLKSLDLSSFNTSSLVSISCMFYECESITSIDVSSFNTSKITSMTGLFFNCMNLINLDISNFNTSNVTDFHSTFYCCKKIESLDLSNFNTSNVNSMYRMFYDCRKLINLYVNHFDTSNVTTIYSMFSYCSSLTTLDLSNWDTSNVTSMNGGSTFDVYAGYTTTGYDGMFSGCKSLVSLDISNFDTSKITNLCSMFHSCESLIVLDLSSFDTRNVEDYSRIFEGCKNLTTIYVSDNFVVSNIRYTGNTFSYCYNLVGGAGTTFVAMPGYSHYDIRYLKVDGGSSNPGYLTYKERT